MDCYSHPGLVSMAFLMIFFETLDIIAFQRKCGFCCFSLTRVDFVCLFCHSVLLVKVRTATQPPERQLWPQLSSSSLRLLIVRVSQESARNVAGDRIRIIFFLKFPACVFGFVSFPDIHIYISG